MAYCTNPYVIAAIVGNFYQESTVNPGIWEGLDEYASTGGFGLGQWTDNPPVVMRRMALWNWMTEHGYPIDSGQGQLEFLIAEDIWIPNLIQPSSYATLTDYLNSTSTNLSALVYEFMYHWEGINDSSYNNRYSWASAMLPIFQSSLAERRPWTTGNFYCDNTQATFNSLLVYDFFMGTTPEPPTPPEPPEPPEPYQPTEEEIIALVKSILRKRNKKGGIYIEL